jgi:hypothetical protein
MVLSFSCTENAGDFGTGADIDIIALDEGITNSKKVYLSEVASEVSYIPLETHDSCLIEKVQKIVFCEGSFIISDGKQIYMFDSLGSYIRKIGRNGRGPGEYLRIMDFTCNSDNNSIVIYTPDLKKIVLYSFSGVFENEFTVEHFPTKIASSGNYILACWVYPDYYYNDFFGITKYDFNGSILDRTFKRPQLGLNSSSIRNIPSTSVVRFEYFTDSLTYWEIRSEFIYRVNSTHVPIPRYKILSEFNIPMAEHNSKKIMDNYVYISDYMESSRYIFFTKCGFENDVKHIVYDKKNKEIFNLYYEHEDIAVRLKSGFYNDIDGGFPFLPEGSIFKDRFYCHFYPYLLNKIIEQDPIKNITPKDPVGHRNIVDLASNAEILDNPVIMMVQLND